jgi:uncharacterized protein (TIGR02246 family)
MSSRQLAHKPRTQTLLDRYRQAWAEHDAPAIAALHTEDSVFHTHIGMAPAVGRAAIQAACEDIFATYQDFKATSTRVHVGEDNWVNEWCMTAQVQSGAAPVAISIDCVDVIALSPEGLVARKDVYMDFEHVTAALAR